MWLLASDAGAESERLSRMGFERIGRVSLPEQGLRGFPSIQLAKPFSRLNRLGQAIAKMPSSPRGHIYGISIAVADVGQARRIAEWGYGREMRS